MLHAMYIAYCAYCAQQVGILSRKNVVSELLAEGSAARFWVLVQCTKKLTWFEPLRAMLAVR